MSAKSLIANSLLSATLPLVFLAAAFAPAEAEPASQSERPIPALHSR